LPSARHGAPVQGYKIPLVNEEGDIRRSQAPDDGGRSDEGSGWITTDVAAVALGVSPRTVRRFIDRGSLDARKVGKGIIEAWEVSIDSLYSLRSKREAEGQVHRETAAMSAAADTEADSIADILRELTARLEQRASSEGDLRARLELSERTESSLREDLERVREERRRHQEEAERLRAELAGEIAKGFWRRLFG
jgi:excisionase family DNA binding protein